MNWGPKIFEALDRVSGVQLLLHLSRWNAKPEPAPPKRFEFDGPTIDAVLELLRIVFEERAKATAEYLCDRIDCFVHDPLLFMIDEDIHPPPHRIARIEFVIDRRRNMIQVQLHVPTEPKRTNQRRVYDWRTRSTQWYAVTFEQYASIHQPEHLRLMIAQELLRDLEDTINRELRSVA